MNMEEKEVQDILKANMHYIIKIQAWFRGTLTRKEIKHLKSKQIGSSKYFTFVEFKETVSANNKGSLMQPREKRQPYQFKTGAIYDGEWKGGFRDGQGKQTWPDGAYYIG
jgi:hypothetical protein